MSKPAWLELFDESQPQAIIELLQKHPQQFAKRATALCQLLQAYYLDHRVDPRKMSVTKRSEVEFTEALELLSYLGRLTALAEGPYFAFKAGLFEPEIIKRFESFWAEGWPYLQPLQDPNARKRAQQRHDASKQLRPATTCVPGTVCEDFNKLVSDGRAKRDVASILAVRYGTSADAVRKAMRKK